MFDNRAMVLVACLLGATTVPALAAPAPAPATRPSAYLVNLKARVGVLTRQLAAADEVDAQAAEIALSALQPQAMPFMEEALLDPALPPAALDRLKTLADRERPRAAARLRNYDRLLAARKEYLSGAVKAYFRIGKHNPIWDDAAKHGMELTAMDPTVSNAPARVALEQAIALGCDDPLILALEALQLNVTYGARADTVQRLFNSAADEIAASRYPMYYKMFCYVHAFRHQMYIANPLIYGGTPMPMEISSRLDSLTRHIEKEWVYMEVDNATEDQTLELASLALIPPGEIYPLMTMPRCELIRVLIEKRFPDSPRVMSLKGRLYVQYAWEARGGDWGANVTEDQWKLFKERLAIADTALSASWDKDPTWAETAKAMILVEMGQGRGRDRMELWFKRGQEADPDNTDICRQKLLYLQPKWHGDLPSLLKFGYECVETQNWKACTPLLLETALEMMSQYMKDPADVFADPGVWPAVQSMYEPYLRADPKNVWVRSQYASYASQAGQWEIARRQFDLLGKNAYPQRFGGLEKMQRYQAEAKEKGTPVGAQPKVAPRPAPARIPSKLD